MEPVYQLPVRVLVFVLVREAGRIQALLVERSRTRGGGWFGFSGPVESGERLAGAAARILHGQTGFPPDLVPQLLAGYLHEMPIAAPARARYGPGTRCIAEYALWVRSPALEEPRLNPDRYADHAWLAPERALGRLALAMHARALRLAVAALQAWAPAPAHPGWTDWRQPCRRKR